MNRRDTDWKSLCKLQLENYQVTGGLIQASGQVPDHSVKWLRSWVWMRGF